jgi:hypothetical protein
MLQVLSLIRWWMLMAAQPWDVLVVARVQEGSSGRLGVQRSAVAAAGAAASAAAVEGALPLTHVKVQLPHRRRS